MLPFHLRAASSETFGGPHVLLKSSKFLRLALLQLCLTCLCTRLPSIPLHKDSAPCNHSLLVSPTSMPTKLTPSHMQHSSQSIIPSRLSLISRSHPSWVKCPLFSASMVNATLILSPLVDSRLPEDRSGIQNIAPHPSAKCPHSNLWDLSLNPHTWQRGTKIADIKLQA